MADLKSSVIEFCTDIGDDPLLVQGAGGNVSWKDGATLWVKASGTWLADAATDNIFVPVDLNALHTAINSGNFSVTPALIDKADLKPSIETLLHALMPHRVVVHLHAIEILAYLVRRNCENELASLLGSKVHYVIVDYFKPGAELAVAIKNELDDNLDAKVIFLKNHGVVIGGADVNEIRKTLSLIIELLQLSVDEDSQPAQPNTPGFFVDEHIPIEGYAAIDDKQLHQLAINTRLFDRLQADWALYPDHVVFLGPCAHLYNSFNEWKSALALATDSPELVFVRGQGVFVKTSFNKTKAVQLRCYYDVLRRQPQGAELNPISSEDISDLLTRDDEKHRMSLSKK